MYWLARSSLRRDVDHRRVIADSREIKGVVTRLRRITTLYTSWYVDYSYSVAGQEYHSYGAIAQQRWKSLRVGSPIGISYLPSSPAKSFPSADPPAARSLWPIFILCPLGALLFLWIGASELLRMRNGWYCLARGRPAPAVVTGAEQKSTSRGARYFIVHYEFPLPGGVPCKGSCRAKKRPPREGSVICILYDPDKPSHSAPYPMTSMELVTG